MNVAFVVIPFSAATSAALFVVWHDFPHVREFPAAQPADIVLFSHFPHREPVHFPRCADFPIAADVVLIRNSLNSIHGLVARFMLWEFFTTAAIESMMDWAVLSAL
ncbi:MAG TPA: hypothetical protein VFX22_05635 [Candidatus Kapabacteria bacterium]|nr:hypothetical protein [Candidatus Kapabacteria bacterium]